MLLRTTVFSSGRTVRPIAPRMFRALPDGQPRFLPAARVTWRELGKLGGSSGESGGSSGESDTLRPNRRTQNVATAVRRHEEADSRLPPRIMAPRKGTGHLSSWISSRTSAPVRLGPQPLADNGCKGGGAILLQQGAELQDRGLLKRDCGRSLHLPDSHSSSAAHHDIPPPAGPFDRA